MTHAWHAEPPFSIDAEMALVGALLCSNQLFDAVRAIVEPHHLYVNQHRIAYQAIERHIRAGHAVDSVSLVFALKDDAELNDPQIGGARKFLAKLAASAETLERTQVLSYAKQVAELWRRRETISLAEHLISTARDVRSEDFEPTVRTFHERIPPQVEAAPCTMPALDLARVEEDDFPPTRWLIEEWHPIGSGGMFAGVGSIGKSYLELVKMVCLASGKPFLGYEVEPCPVLAYFAEDTFDQIGRRLTTICRELGVSARSLTPRLHIVSTHGEHRTLFASDRGSLTVEPTPWAEQVVERARKLGARYLCLDNIGRYCAIEYSMNNNQVFSMFTHLDKFAKEIDGSATLLHHPSKAGVKEVKPDNYGATVYDLVGGAGALVNAPRFSHTLRWLELPGEEGKVRCLQSHKSNHGREIALRLEAPAGKCVVNNTGEIELENLMREQQGERSRSRSRSTLEALASLYKTYRRAVTLDEIVHEAIRRGIVGEVDENSKEFRAQMRDRRRTIRSHINHHKDAVDARDNETFAIHPGHLGA